MTLDDVSGRKAAYGDDEKKNPLVRSISCGNVRLAIFENASGHRSEATPYYTVNASRSYRDEAGNWKSTSTFYKSHLPQLIYTCQRALEFIEDAESEALSPPF
jgi:hypothetical protein